MAHYPIHDGVFMYCSLACSPQKSVVVTFKAPRGFKLRGRFFIAGIRESALVAGRDSL